MKSVSSKANEKIIKTNFKVIKIKVTTHKVLIKPCKLDLVFSFKINKKPNNINEKRIIIFIGLVGIDIPAYFIKATITPFNTILKIRS